MDGEVRTRCVPAPLVKSSCSEPAGKPEPERSRCCVGIDRLALYRRGGDALDAMRKRRTVLPAPGRFAGQVVAAADVRPWDAAAVSMVAALLEVPEPAASPAADWTSAGRLAAAATLVLGPGLQLASILLEPDTDSTVDAVGWIAAHPDRADLAQVLFLLAMPFMLGAALVYVLLSRRRSPRLAYAGGILLGFGFVGLSAVAGYETLAIALAQDGRFDSTALAEVLAEMSSPPAIAMLLILIPFCVLRPAHLGRRPVALTRRPARRCAPHRDLHPRGPLPQRGAWARPELRRSRDRVCRRMLDRLVCCGRESSARREVTERGGPRVGVIRP